MFGFVDSFLVSGLSTFIFSLSAELLFNLGIVILLPLSGLERPDVEAGDDNLLTFSELDRAGVVDVVGGAGEVVLSTDRAGFMKGLETPPPSPTLWPGGGGGGGEVCLTRLLVLALFLTTNDLWVASDLSVVIVGLREPRTGLSCIWNVITLSVMMIIPYLGVPSYGQQVGQAWLHTGAQH